MRRNQSGQSLVELGIVVALFITLTLGAVEFGYAFMALHTITQASSAGARYASALEVGSRGTCGVITDAGKSQVQGRVTSQIGGVVNVTNVAVTQTPAPLTTTPCADLTATIPTVTVTVTGSIPYLFGLLGSGALSFTRAQTFRDEGR